MHIAQRPQHRSQPSATTARRAAHAPPVAAVAPVQRAADPVVRDDRLGELLAGAVQRRAVDGPVLQRAIIAIDGPTDKAPARKITRNCLANLTQSGGRGAAAGPNAVKRIKAPKLAQNESLYILGHGNTDEIGDLEPDELGAWILKWYGKRPYRGKIKLVACSSGIAPDLGAASYAENLRDYLRDNATTKFHPASVDGVLGIAWVDEKLDKIVAIDDDAYETAETGGTDVEGAFAIEDPRQRRKALKGIFGKPDDVGSSVHTGKPGAKVRFLTNLPDLPPPTPWSFTRALGRLIPCIP
jgi:hypothetical protein